MKIWKAHKISLSMSFPSSKIMLSKHAGEIKNLFFLHCCLAKNCGQSQGICTTVWDARTDDNKWCKNKLWRVRSHYSHLRLFKKLIIGRERVAESTMNYVATDVNTGDNIIVRSIGRKQKQNDITNKKRGGQKDIESQKKWNLERIL